MAQVVSWLEGGCEGIDRGPAVAHGPAGIVRAIVEGILSLEPDDGESLRARDERIRQAVLDEPPMLEGLDVQPSGALSFEASHWLFDWVVRACRGVLGDAPNYMEVRVVDQEVEPHEAYVVRVQRAHGQTPAQLRAVDQARVTRLEGALRDLADDIERRARGGFCTICDSGEGCHTSDCSVHRATLAIYDRPEEGEGDT